MNSPAIPALINDTMIPEAIMYLTACEIDSFFSLSTMPLKVPSKIPTVPRFAKLVVKTVKTHCICRLKFSISG